MQIVYFGRCVSWTIIDAIPCFQMWKIQLDKTPTAAEQWECTKGVLSSHFHFAIELGCTWFENALGSLPAMEEYVAPNSFFLRI